MWTADNRPRYNRDKLRYPSDLTSHYSINLLILSAESSQEVSNCPFHLGNPGLWLL